MISYVIHANHMHVYKDHSEYENILSHILCNPRSIIHLIPLHTIYVLNGTRPHTNKVVSVFCGSQTDILSLVVTVPFAFKD